MSNRLSKTVRDRDPFVPYRLQDWKIFQRRSGPGKAFHSLLETIRWKIYQQPLIFQFFEERRRGYFKQITQGSAVDEKKFQNKANFSENSKFLCNFFWCRFSGDCQPPGIVNQTGNSLGHVRLCNSVDNRYQLDSIHQVLHRIGDILSIS